MKKRFLYGVGVSLVFAMALTGCQESLVDANATDESEKIVKRYQTEETTKIVKRYQTAGDETEKIVKRY